MSKLVWLELHIALDHFRTRTLYVRLWDLSWSLEIYPGILGVSMDEMDATNLSFPTLSSYTVTAAIHTLRCWVVSLGKQTLLSDSCQYTEMYDSNLILISLCLKTPLYFQFRVGVLAASTHPACPN